MSTNTAQGWKAPTRSFLWKWILGSALGGMAGLVLFSISGMMMFFGLSDAPRPANLPLPSMSMIIREGLGIGTLLAAAVGLPLGIIQGIMLYRRFKVLCTLWWVPVYGMGMILPMSWIVTIWLFFKTLLTIPVLILTWFAAGVTIGSLQWMILRRLVSRGFWLVPWNLVAMLGFMLWVAFGGSFDELINFLVFIFGGLVGPMLYGIITGLVIQKTKDQQDTMDSIPGRG